MQQKNNPQPPSSASGQGIRAQHGLGLINEVNEVKPATAFGCRSIIIAALYWQMALVTLQTQF
jgi:hypothetical protein